MLIEGVGRVAWECRERPDATGQSAELYQDSLKEASLIQTLFDVGSTKLPKRSTCLDIIKYSWPNLQTTL